MIGSWIYVVVLVCSISTTNCWTLLDGNGYEYKDGERISLSLKNDENSSVSDISHKLIHKLMLMTPFSTVTFQLLDLPSYVLFVVTQVHSFKYNLTLSYKPEIQPSFHVNGSNIGLVKQNTGMPPHDMEFFIINQNPVPVMCLLAFEAFRNDDPVPGGCNREFAVENAPYLLLKYDDATVQMYMQPAASTGLDPDCDTFPSPVELEVYHLYMEERNFTSEAYFEAIKKMMTVDGMSRIGTLVPPPIEGGDLRRIHAAYPGTGSVYGVVARSQNGNVAAYVPAVTYACGNKISAHDDCEIFTEPWSEVLCALMIFIGILMCVSGHKRFLTSSSFVSFLWGMVIGCIIPGMNSGFDILDFEFLGVLIGFLFVLVWLILWYFLGSPFIAALSSTLALGFLLASLIMYAGLGSALWLTYDFSFWCVFLSITVTVPILFMSAMHVGNMVACATIGAFLFIAPIDHYVGSNLKYIFLNTMRRAMYSDFRFATVDPPFELTDLLIILTWLTLAGGGTVVQLCRHGNQPPFPRRNPVGCCRSSQPPAPSVSGAPSASVNPSAGASGTTSRRRSLLQLAAVIWSGGGCVGGERTPLLVDVRIPDESGSSDSVFESPVRPTTPPAPHAPPAAAQLPDKDELAASTEKLANKLLAVLEAPVPDE